MVNPAVALGTKVTLVGIPDVSSHEAGAVMFGQATVTQRLSADCDNSHLASYDEPSTEKLRAPTYYRIKAPAKWPASSYAIAILPPAGEVAITGRTVRGDLDRDGIAESFRSCTSGEGIHLQIWSGEPLTGRPRWHWYVYAGYDTVYTCTDKDYFGRILNNR